MTIRRQPKGTPWGGQFARSAHDDDNDLTFSSPDTEVHVHPWWTMEDE